MLSHTMSRKKNAIISPQSVERSVHIIVNVTTVITSMSLRSSRQPIIVNVTTVITSTDHRQCHYGNHVNVTTVITSSDHRQCHYGHHVNRCLKFINVELFMAYKVKLQTCNNKWLINVSLLKLHIGYQFIAVSCAFVNCKKERAKRKHHVMGTQLPLLWWTHCLSYLGPFVRCVKYTHTRTYQLLSSFFKTDTYFVCQYRLVIH